MPHSPTHTQPLPGWPLPEASPRLASPSGPTSLLWPCSSPRCQNRSLPPGAGSVGPTQERPVRQSGGGKERLQPVPPGPPWDCDPAGSSCPRSAGGRGVGRGQGRIKYKQCPVHSRCSKPTCQVKTHNLVVFLHCLSPRSPPSQRTVSQLCIPVSPSAGTL